MLVQQLMALNPDANKKKMLRAQCLPTRIARLLIERLLNSQSPLEQSCALELCTNGGVTSFRHNY